MTARITPVPPGASLTNPVLVRGGRLLLGLRRAADGFTLHAIDLHTDVELWSVTLVTWPTLCVHEDAGFVATCEQQVLSTWNLDTGAPHGPLLHGFHARAALPSGRLLTLENVAGVRPDGVHVDEGTRACVVDVVDNRVVSHFGLAGRVDHVAVDDAGTRLVAYTPLDDPKGAHRSVLWDIASKTPLLSLDEALSSPTLRFQPGRSDTMVLPYHYGLGGPVLIAVDATDGATPRLDTAVIVDDEPDRPPEQSTALSRDGRFLAAAYGEDRDNHWFVGAPICVWDLQTRRRHDTPLRSTSSTTLLAFDDDSLVAVVEAADKRFVNRVARTW